MKTPKLTPKDRAEQKAHLIKLLRREFELAVNTAYERRELELSKHCSRVAHSPSNFPSKPQTKGTMSKTKSPDISGMTMSQIQKLVDELNGKANAPLPPIKPAKSGEWLWRVGATYLIRTVSYHYTGIFVGFNGPNNSEVVLKDAAWIADTGRFMQAVQDGTLGEVEPYPNDALVGINRTAIADFCEVKWPTPRSQQ